MSKIPNELVEEYLKEIPAKYQEEVLDLILSKDYDKMEAEQAVKEFYTPKNNGVEPKIRWVDNPVVLREEFKGQEIQIFSTYFNVNWVYFFYTFMNYLDTDDNREKVDKSIFDEYNGTREESVVAYNIFKNIFGLVELPTTNSDGEEVKYGEIILILKPERVCIDNDRLHSLDGPAFEYESGPTFYYIEGVQMEAEMWGRMVKTAMADEHSPYSDELVALEKDEVVSRIAKIEKELGRELELYSVEDILKIDNQEQKSKVIKWIGFNIIVDKATVLDEEDVTTHKGDIEKYQLLEIDLGLEPDSIPSRFVRVACWSTLREYVLQVDPRSEQCNTAMGAIAWTCRKPDGSRCTEEEYRQLEFQT